MVDIVTDFANVDDDWNYLALVEDVRSGIEPAPGVRLVAGNEQDRWTVQVIDLTNGIVRFKLIESVAQTEVKSGSQRASANADFHTARSVRP